MTATIAQLGARALRKCIVAIVPDASRPIAGLAQTPAQIADDMLRQMGIVVPEVARPMAGAIVSQADLAARALRAVGANPATLGGGIISGVVWALPAVATAALLKLAVIAPDDDLSEPDRVNDQADAAQKAATVHDMLVALDFVTWASNAIPAAVFDAYVVMTANLLAPGYGKPASLDAFAAAQAMVRQQALAGAFGQALAAAKVAAVHDELVSLALVSWEIGAVPAAHAENYVRLVELLLAPIYRPVTADDRKVSLEVHSAVIAEMTRAAMVVGAMARAIDRVGVVHEELNALGLVDWPLAAIPVSVSDCYMAMASSKMTAEGGIVVPLAEYAGWVQRVRLVVMGGPRGQALAEQKIRATHYSLEARGRTRWTLYDIPVHCEEAYVMKAAVLLGPEVGVKVDPNWDTQAEMELMRIVSLPSLREPVRAEYF